MNADERRFNANKGARAAGPCRGAAIIAVLPFLCSSALICGCAADNKKPTTQPTSLRQRQDQMLANPGDYKMDSPNTDITGGGIGHFDKSAFKKDMDDVFNP